MRSMRGIYIRHKYRESGTRANLQFRLAISRTNRTTPGWQGRGRKTTTLRVNANEYGCVNFFRISNGAICLVGRVEDLGNTLAHHQSE
jgi:hypothetical protein